MKQFFFLSILSFFYAQVAFCLAPADSMGTKARSSVSIGLGLNYTSLKNETISPLIHAGLGLPIQLAFRRESDRRKQYIQISYLNRHLSSRFNNTTTELRSGVAYTYLQRINRNRYTPVFAGAEVALQVAFRNNPFGANNLSGEIINSVNATALASHSIGNHKVELQAACSVVGYNIRTHTNLYFGTVPEGTFQGIVSAGQWEFPPDFFNATVRLTYYIPPSSPHISWRFDYMGSFQQFHQQQYLGMLQHQFTAALTYTF